MPTPTTKHLLNLVAGVVLPLETLERTMVMPFDKTRHENVAEHSFMLSTLACALAAQLDASLDLGLVAQFAIVHDVVEVHAGDTSVWASAEKLAAKQAAEHASLQQIADEQRAFPWLAKTIGAYERRDSPEARFVYALDKILAHMLVILGNYHPVQPTRRAYLERENIARQKIGEFPALLPYFDDLCAIYARSPHFYSTEQ